MTALLKDVRLGDVLDIRDGTHGTPKYVERGIPLITSKNLTESGLCFREISYISQQDHEEISKRSAVAEGDILYGMIGTIGKPTIVEASIKFSIKNVALFKSSNPEIDNRYLLNLLKSNVISAQIIQASRGGTQKFVSLGALRGLKATFPPLPEQRRIAAILEKADALRAKRREAIAKLDQLLQSVFLEMFGDETDASVTVADITASETAMRTGPFGSQLLHSEFVDSGIAVLGIDNAVSNQFAWGKPRYITEQKYAKLSRYRVLPSDVLITIMGTCGRCAVVPEDIPLAINTKHLCCISLDRSKCEPEFLHSYFLMHPVARNYLESRVKGAIMSGLNMGIIKELPIALPSIERQRQFVAIKMQLRQQQARSESQLARLEHLFAAIQDQAFAGTL